MRYGFGTFSERFLSVISLKRLRFSRTSQRLSDRLPVVQASSIFHKSGRLQSSLYISSGAQSTSAILRLSMSWKRRCIVSGKDAGIVRCQKNFVDRPVIVRKFWKAVMEYLHSLVQTVCIPEKIYPANKTKNVLSPACRDKRARGKMRIHRIFRKRSLHWDSRPAKGTLQHPFQTRRLQGLSGRTLWKGLPVHRENAGRNQSFADPRLFGYTRLYKLAPCYAVFPFSFHYGVKWMRTCRAAIHCQVTPVFPPVSKAFFCRTAGYRRDEFYRVEAYSWLRNRPDKEICCSADTIGRVWLFSVISIPKNLGIFDNFLIWKGFSGLWGGSKKYFSDMDW